MIEFYCENCGQKIGAPETLIGESRQCPNCKSKVIVPDAQSAKSAEKPDIPAKPHKKLKYTDYEWTLLDVRQQYEVKNLSADQAGVSDGLDDKKHSRKDEPKEIQYGEERTFPWFIDIFLYPLSLPGLMHLAIFAGVPALMLILANFIPVVLTILFYRVCLIIGCLFVLYMFWYFAECVRDSADGWVRAPQGMGGIPELSDMFKQMINIIGCFAFLLLPAIIYILLTGRADIIALLFLVAAVFMYPICFLSVVLHDSLSGFDPRILLNSIRKTFWPYLGLVLLFVLFAASSCVICLFETNSIFVEIILLFVMFYVALILFHLTGRFYWKYKEKLKWNLQS
ncbi:MAG: hypothetical protein JW715_11580 [Sedimentisphaerales bacterium]|nr:hypothetical protein [Sedimentisphaerales bacterium]